MDLKPAFDVIRATPFATWVGESSWGFPISESIHVLAVVLVVGSIAFVDLRLVGIVGRPSRITEMTRDMLPWTWGAFAIALLSGLAMFSSNPDVYFNNTAFRLKMLCLVIAGVNMLIFERITVRSVDQWDLELPAPPAAKVAGLVSLFFWILVVGCGRWIGFTL